MSKASWRLGTLERYPVREASSWALLFTAESELFKVRMWRADIGRTMLDRRELEDVLPAAVTGLRARLEAAQLQLTVARGENLRTRDVIRRHLEKGCPSQSLQELLDQFADPPR